MIKQIGLVLAAVGIFWSSMANAEDLDRRILVHNLSKKRITEMYASPIDQGNWTYNMIQGPEDWIRSGETKIADIDDGTGYCRYDLRVVLPDGRHAEKFNVNVCVHPGDALLEWFIHD